MLTKTKILNNKQNKTPQKLQKLSKTIDFRNILKKKSN